MINLHQNFRKNQKSLLAMEDKAINSRRRRLLHRIFFHSIIFIWLCPPSHVASADRLCKGSTKWARDAAGTKERSTPFDQTLPRPSRSFVIFHGILSRFGQLDLLRISASMSLSFFRNRIGLIPYCAQDAELLVRFGKVFNSFF